MFKRALYSLKRALRILLRALYILRRALYILKRAYWKRNAMGHGWRAQPPSPAATHCAPLYILKRAYLTRILLFQYGCLCHTALVGRQILKKQKGGKIERRKQNLIIIIIILIKRDAPFQARLH